MLRARLVRRLRPDGRQPLPAERLDLEALRFPDSRLVKEAFAIGDEAYEPWLLNHCLRTYLWGGLVGQLERVPVDLEALLVAAIFHDLGLTKKYASDDCECFAVAGARVAEQKLAGLAPPQLVNEVAESVALHLSATVRPDEGGLNYLLHQGALIDVVGRGLGKVQPLVPRVLERHPRLAFKKRIIETLSRETARHPHGRLAMVSRVGFLGLIERARFDE
ncbi:MAG: HD domain-containing protein [Deltaproteobacteria bacterium]|nr:HD domain-containing protein [Deltaproteobacteria bacterium]